jgi:hypothetical protein
MKTHLVLQIEDHVAPFEVSHWTTIRDNKAAAAATVHPELDKIFAKYRLPVWITREYQPSKNTWSEDEIKSRLNRFYRVILQEDSAIPADLIRDIALLPIIKQVRMGTIGRSDLPSLRPAQMSADTGADSRRAIYL